MAVALKAPDLAAAINASETDAARVLAVASALVERYAPAAPSHVQDEAVIRVSGYLLQIQPGAPRQVSAGSVQTSIWIPTGSSPLRSSGATAILAPWKRRRAL